MNSKRLNVIDVAKGIGIILVVFAHVYYEHNTLVLIYSFHMPLFFLISGMLFKKEKYPKFAPFLLKRVKRLLIPYVIYEVLSIWCLHIASGKFEGMFEVSVEIYKEYFRQILVSNWSGTHVNQPLWFLPCLFLVEIIYYFLSKAKKIVRIPVCILMVYFGWLLESGLLPFDNMLLPWSLDSALFALGFYAFGNLCAQPMQNMIGKISANKYKIPLCIVISTVLVLIWKPLAIMNDKVTLGTKVLNNGFLLYATGILGTLIVVTISILFEKSRFLTYCGRNSFEIMASHYVIRKCLIVPLYVVKYGEKYDREVLQEAWMPCLAVFVLSLLFTIIYNQLRALVTKMVRKR